MPSWGQLRCGAGVRLPGAEEKLTPCAGGMADNPSHARNRNAA